MEDDLILNLVYTKEPGLEDDSPSKIFINTENNVNEKGEHNSVDLKNSSQLNKSVLTNNENQFQSHDQSDSTVKFSSKSSNVVYKKKESGFKTVTGKSLQTKPNLEFDNLNLKLDAAEKNITEDNVYHSKTVFSELELFPKLIQHVMQKMHFQKLTKVQEKAIPTLLVGKDALITSETGSGKTLAYAVPVFHSLHETLPTITRTDGPIALIFTPTRELALQSYEVFHSLTQCAVRIVATCLMGGQKRKSEKAHIRKGINIIVSTPGRFVDHLKNTSCLDLQNVSWLVFDEADRLLDMGFQDQINHILTAVQERSDYTQQVVLLSATLSPGVEKLVSLSLKNPVRIEMKPENKKSDYVFIECQTGLRLEKASLPKSLTQYVTLVPSKLHLIALVAFVNMHCFQQNEKLLVFLSCRDSVIFHYNILKKVEVP